MKYELDSTMNAPVKQMTDKQLEEYLARVRGIYVDLAKKVG